MSRVSRNPITPSRSNASKGKKKLRHHRKRRRKKRTSVRDRSVDRNPIRRKEGSVRKGNVRVSRPLPLLPQRVGMGKPLSVRRRRSLSVLIFVHAQPQKSLVARGARRGLSLILRGGVRLY